MTEWRVPAHSASKHIATRNLGIITTHCLYYWRMLPPNVQSFYEVEDMVGDVVLKVVARARRYKKSKARESTWVHAVAANECKSILSRYHARIRGAKVTDALDDTQHFAANSSLKRREAVNAINRMLEFGSDPACELLSSILTGKIYSERTQDIRRFIEHDKALLDQLRKLAKNCSATFEDFQLVLQYAIV